jgi:methylmalonyl-CoA/ethylmalonyl-CoA epimerase
MLDKLEHIGIAVADLDKANEVFSLLLGTKPYKSESVESEKVTTSFFKCGNSKIELLASSADNGPIARFIEKKGEGIHHLAFGVDNIYREIERLKALGFRMLNEEPKEGADNKLIAFIHPSSCGGVLVELCQEKP